METIKKKLEKLIQKYFKKKKIISQDIAIRA